MRRWVSAAFDAATGDASEGRSLAGVVGSGTRGLWSDGATMWVADGPAARIDAYDLGSGEQVPALGFGGLADAGNSEPAGIWSDGDTMWVLDHLQHRVFAYRMAPNTAQTPTDQQDQADQQNADQQAQGQQQDAEQNADEQQHGQADQQDQADEQHGDEQQQEQADQQNAEQQHGQGGDEQQDQQQEQVVVRAEDEIGEVVLWSGAAGELTISWEAPVLVPFEYRVSWAREDLEFLSFRFANEAHRGNEWPAADATSVTLSGLEEGAAYKVQLRARFRDARGKVSASPWTNETAATVHSAASLLAHQQAQQRDEQQGVDESSVHQEQGTQDDQDAEEPQIELPPPQIEFVEFVEQENGDDEEPVAAQQNTDSEPAWTLVGNLGSWGSATCSTVIRDAHLGLSGWAVYFNTGTNPEGWELDEIEMDLLEGVGIDVEQCPAAHWLGVDVPCIALEGPSPITEGLNTFVPTTDGVVLSGDSSYAIVFSRRSGLSEVTPRLSWTNAYSEGETHSASAGWTLAELHRKKYDDSWSRLLNTQDAQVSGVHWTKEIPSNLVYRTEIPGYDNFGGELRFRVVGRPVGGQVNLAPFFRDWKVPDGADPLSFAVDEDRGGGAAVGSLRARDPDGDALSFTVSGQDVDAFNEDFVIDAAGRVLVAPGRSLDYESRSRYSVRVSVSDGVDEAGQISDSSDDEVALTVTVRDVPETGTLTFDPPSPVVGQPVTVSIHDSDGEVSLVKVAWYRGTSETVSRTDYADYERIGYYEPGWSIPQAYSGESYTPTEDDVGKYLMVYAYYWDRLSGGRIMHDLRAVRTPGQVVAAP
ncbi:cadherin domain-containing protein [Candidatus Poriferisodalis sp.]|uniref:cadherin domain-containing protein n=2 Tax=Candidatus Poriferisodalis sp. TaxID=3101277 RepID=UPI003B016654